MKTAHFAGLAAILCLAAQLAPAAILIPSGEKNSSKEEANRALVLDFWAKFFRGGTDDWAKWLSPDFVNHDPYEPSGGKTFADFVKANAMRAAAAPPSSTTPRPAPTEPDRLFFMADGDLVLIVYPGNNPEDLTENVHGNIVRVKDGKITDWWLIGEFAGRANKPKPYANNKAGVQPMRRTP